MKILLLDIESAPNTAHVWGLFKQNISISQLMDSSYVLCWAAKWLGESEIYFDSVYKSRPRKMLSRIHKLLEEADAVIHYSGTRFDIPTLNKEFLLYGFAPPATYRQIDLLLVARNRFRFPSNKLDYVANALGLGQKHKHAGHDLWVQCMNNDAEAWATMEEYNKNDVVLLEGVYGVFRPWIKNHPNHGLYRDNDSVEDVCPNCGGTHLRKRGFTYTAASKFQRFQCNDCGTWSRSKKAEKLVNNITNDRV